MDDGRMVHAECHGRSYDIPEVWLMGFCTARDGDDSPRTVWEAIAWWAWQVALEELEHAERVKLEG